MALDTDYKTHAQFHLYCGYSKVVETEGADSISLTNTFMGMAIDVELRRPHLSTITSGIMNTRDALEFIMAGDTAIEVGTANFIKTISCSRELNIFL